ncbi:MAG: T9SS type A sorting domain-containing protein [Bacteroidota bacterium]|nr:T9SS type A sorting domain-containing protein [Bacteroidota bacterium]
MKTFITIFLSLLAIANANSQTWDWAILTKGLERIKVSYADNGNVFITGTFKDSCLIQNTKITGDDIRPNMLISMLDAGGNFQWSRVIYSDSEVICSDSEGDNLYFSIPSSWLAGFITDSSSFTCMHLFGISSSGNIIYHRKEGGDFSSLLHASDLTAMQGKIYVSGHYYGSPSVSGQALANSSEKGGYFARYDLMGNLELVKELISPSEDVDARKITSDINGHIYIFGGFQPNMEIGNLDTVITLPLTTYVAAILRFDANGNYLSLENNVSGYFYNLETFYETGSKSLRLIQEGCNHCQAGTVIIGADSPGADTTWMYRQGAGNVYGDAESMYPGDMSVTDNLIYVAGSYSGNFLAGSDSLAGSGLFIFKMDHNGNFIRVDTVNENLAAKDISDFRDGSMIVFGGLYDTAFLGPNFLPMSGHYPGGYSGFIAKYSELSTGIVTVPASTHEEISIFPNPSSGIVNINFEKSFTGKVCIYNPLGECVYYARIQNANAETIELMSSEGIYFIELSNEKEKTVKKLILN